MLLPTHQEIQHNLTLFPRLLVLSGNYWADNDDDSRRAVSSRAALHRRRLTRALRRAAAGWIALSTSSIPAISAALRPIFVLKSLRVGGRMGPIIAAFFIWLWLASPLMRAPDLFVRSGAFFPRILRADRPGIPGHGRWRRSGTQLKCRRPSG